MWNITIFDKFKFLFKLKNNLKSLASLTYQKLSPQSQIFIHDFVTSETKDYYNNPSIFDSIFFELRTRCNSKCNFCAASIQNEVRPDVTMEFNLYEKAIKELELIKYDKRICFHVNNDPLLVKNLHEYISLARKKCPNAWIQILTNGRSLNNKNGLAMLNAGIDELSINIYQEKKTNITPTNILNFENEVLYKFYKAKNIYGGNPGIIEEKKYPHYIKYTKASRLIYETLSNRAGSAPNKKNNHVIPKLGYCSHPFSQFNITVNGEVSQCCADFNFDSKMGNISNRSIMEIWNDKKFTRTREDLKKGNRQDNLLCSKCDHFGVNSIPNSFLKKQLFKLLFINDS